MTNENTNNNDERRSPTFLNAEELETLENKLRADIDSGELTHEEVWKVIAGHIATIVSRFEYRPVHTAAMMGVCLHQLPVSLDQLLEAYNHDERYARIKTAFSMVEDKLWNLYNMNAIYKTDDAKDSVEAWKEINAFMSVTSVWQDVCYLSAIITQLAEQMHENWGQLIDEKGPSEGNLKALKCWKSLSEAAQFAEEMTDKHNMQRDEDKK